MAGSVAVRWMTEGRGSSNAKAKRELDWEPRWRSWREGFRRALGDAGPSSASHPVTSEELRVPLDKRG
jgi:2-alkyl-3-oxoalkanoate reductase